MKKSVFRVNKVKSPSRTILLLFFAFISINSLAQQTPPDKEKDPSWLRKNGNKVVKRLMGVMTQDPVDEAATINVRSEDAYLPYAGRTIRHISIRRIGFERTILDTARHFQTFVSKAANRLHVDTKEFVIRDNLFIKEGQPLNPYRVADNERTLRNLSFMLDARILVRPVIGSTNTVDLIVITRDVFSFGGSFEPQAITKYKISAQETNLAGAGQRVQIGMVYDIDRNPRAGMEFIYQKVNVMGSFVDATVGYSKINTGISIGNENEDAYYFRLSRPLYQPFARWAGGLELSNNNSVNAYKKPDSLFARYRYAIQDYWAGYSFGHKNLPTDLRENRNRKFIAVRAFQQQFSQLPTIELTEPDFFAYRSRTSILTQLTFFRQDFYKTQYVLGFGRTEDVAHGYRASFTSGWETELGIKRSYFGGEGYWTRVLPTGTILTYTAKLASYFMDSKSQDGLLSLDFTRFSKVYERGIHKIRLQSEIGYAVLFNRYIKRGIDIRDVNGILGFTPDSLVGTRRMVVSQEATIFTPSKFFGFRLAPVVRIDLAMINHAKEFLITSDNFYSGVSVGLRARNENLIFNTIEARAFYYPHVTEHVQHLQFSIGTNIKIRYPTNLVNAPATVFNP